jgi:hypothetical protein
MTSVNRSGATATPIYDSLINEQGDIPTEVRQVAERAKKDASEAVDWRDRDRHDWDVHDWDRQDWGRQEKAEGTDHKNHHDGRPDESPAADAG